MLQKVLVDVVGLDPKVYRVLAGEVSGVGGVRVRYLDSLVPGLGALGWIHLVVGVGQEVFVVEVVCEVGDVLTAEISNCF